MLLAPLAGGDAPRDAAEARAYDVVYYTSEDDREALRGKHENISLQHAFGVSFDALRAADADALEAS